MVFGTELADEVVGVRGGEGVAAAASPPRRHDEGGANVARQADARGDLVGAEEEAGRDVDAARGECPALVDLVDEEGRLVAGRPRKAEAGREGGGKGDRPVGEGNDAARAPRAAGPAPSPAAR